MSTKKVGIVSNTSLYTFFHSLEAVVLLDGGADGVDEERRRFLGETAPSNAATAAAGGTVAIDLRMGPV